MEVLSEAGNSGLSPEVAVACYLIFAAIVLAIGAVLAP